MKWLGKNIPPGAPISDRAPAFFYQPMKWVGKKILKNGRETLFPPIPLEWEGTLKKGARNRRKTRVFIRPGPPENGMPFSEGTRA